jgi:deoxyribodipyrimidine photo-lyase
VQEVIWRAYFKGWLEQRPQVWTLYKDGLQQDLADLGRDQRLQDAVGRAQTGQTGLACMDAWAKELVQTGYLHNHTRMWFASIWIFTLGLPWRIGADFFLRHLLDGDPAANTLSWRWVAGLHTRGKPYYAQAGNIAHCTGQRFVPADTDLAPVGRGLDWTEPDGLPPLLSLRSYAPPQPYQPSALLLTNEDGCLEDFDLSHLDVCTVATLDASHLRSPLAVARAVTQFDTDAMADTAARLGATPVSLQAQAPDALLAWARAAAATQIVTPYVTRGPLCDWLQTAGPLLAQHGITLTEVRRTWDNTIWPHATAGFFQVKKQIPAICAQVLAT